MLILLKTTKSTVPHTRGLHNVPIVLVFNVHVAYYKEINCYIY